MTIRELHSLAFSRGFPRGEVHAILHDMAALAFGVGSLKDCSAEQLKHLASSVRGLFYDRSKDPTSPERAARGRSARPRRGRPDQPGVFKMITPRQVEFITILASELGWTKSLLTGFLQTHFGCDTPAGLGTARRGVEAIQHLKGIKYDRARARRKTN